MLSRRQTSLNVKKTIIIAIDGPAGAGKSTVAKRLAKLLNISYLDTGAMYRALTWKAMKLKINLEDADALARLAKNTEIDLIDEPGGLKVLVDGQDVSHEIRTVEVTNHTFYIARIPNVRDVMVQWQKAMGRKKSLVAEGRDLGTVVFPQATYKFYMDADVAERTRRRFKEFNEKGKNIQERTVMAELRDRDSKDLTRKVGPLRKAEDAVLIDTTHLTIDETVTEILRHIEKDGPITHS